MWSELLEASVNIAIAAGNVIRSTVDLDELGIVNKSTSTENFDPQTIADRNAQLVIVNSLRHLFPSITIVAEEGELLSHDDDTKIESSSFIDLPPHNTSSLNDNEDDDSKYSVWVDPLDGTKRFIEKKYDHVSVLIGIVYKDRAVAGVIYEPFYNKCYGRLIVGGLYMENPYYTFINHHKVTPSWVPITMNTKPVLESTVFAVSSTSTDYIRDATITHLGLTKELVASATGKILAEIIMTPEDRPYQSYLRCRSGTMRWDICAADGILASRNSSNNLEIVSPVTGRKFMYDSSSSCFDNTEGVCCAPRTIIERVPGALQSMKLLCDPECGDFTTTWLRRAVFEETDDKISFKVDESSLIVGQHCLAGKVVVVANNDKTTTVFIKRSLISELPTRTDVSKLTRDLRSYRAEHFFYKEFSKSYESNGVSVATPLYLFSKDSGSGGYVTILKHICDKQQDMLNTELTKMALRYLAKFHAVGWENTAMLEGASSYLWTPSGSWFEYQKRGREELLNASEIWKNFKVAFDLEECYDDLDVRVIENAAWINAQLVNDDMEHKTIIHGDFKTNNLFFSDNSVTAIDWQWSGIGYGAIDVAYLMCTSVSIECCVEEEEELLLLYYYQALPQKCTHSYSFETFKWHYYLAVLEYGRTSMSYFWKNVTPSVCKTNAAFRNKGLVYRSELHARAMVKKLDKLLTVVESARSKLE